MSMRMPGRPAFVPSQEQRSEVKEISLEFHTQCELRQIEVRDAKTKDFVPLEKQRKATVAITGPVILGSPATFLYLTDGGERSTTEVISIKKIYDHKWEIKTNNSVYVLTVDRVDPRPETRKTVLVPEAVRSLGSVTERAKPGEALVGGSLRLNGVFYAQNALKRGQDAVGVKVVGGECVVMVCDGVGGHRKSGDLAEFLVQTVESLHKTTSEDEVKKMIAQRVATFATRERGLHDFDIRTDDTARTTMSLLIHKEGNIFDLHQIGNSPVYIYNVKTGAIRVSYGADRLGEAKKQTIGVAFTEREGWRDTVQYSVRQIKTGSDELVVVASDFFSDNMATDLFYKEKTDSIERKLHIAGQQGDTASQRRLENEKRFILTEQSLFDSFLKEGEGGDASQKRKKRLAWIDSNLKGRPGLEEVEKRFRVYIEQDIFKGLVDEAKRGVPITPQMFEKYCQSRNMWSTKDASIVVVDPAVVVKLSAQAKAEEKYDIKI